MPIKVTCGQGHKLNVPDNLAGRKVRCPRCKDVVAVPGLEETDVEHEALPAPTAVKKTAKPAAPGPEGRPEDEIDDQPPRKGKFGPNPGRSRLPLILGLVALLVVLAGAAAGAYLLFWPEQRRPSPNGSGTVKPS